MAKQLEQAYARFNRKYFGNSLPAIPIRWSINVDKENDAEFYWDEDIEEEQGPCGLIQIAPRLKSDYNHTMIALLHEMVHMKLRKTHHARDCRVGPHSKAWRTEMRRIAAEGAFDRLW